MKRACPSPGRVRRSFFPRDNRQRGSVAVVALAALVIIFTIVMGLLMLAQQTLFVGKRQSQRASLRAMADAGAQYGYWQVAWNKAALPFTEKKHPLGTGTFSVKVTNNSSKVDATIKVVSTASLGAYSETVTRLFARPK